MTNSDPTVVVITVIVDSTYSYKSFITKHSNVQLMYTNKKFGKQSLYIIINKPTSVVEAFLNLLGGPNCSFDGGEGI